MAGKTLGIALLLIASSGCAGKPWLARGGSRSSEADPITPSARVGQAGILPATPGFLPASNAQPAGPSPRFAATQQQLPLHQQPFQPYLTPGGESPNQQSLQPGNLQPGNYGQQLASAPPMAAIPNTSSTPYVPVYENQPPSAPASPPVANVPQQTSPPVAATVNGNAPPAPASPPEMLTADTVRASSYNINDTADVADSGEQPFTSSQPPEADPLAKTADGRPASGDAQLDRHVMPASHITTTASAEESAVKWRDEAIRALAALEKELTTGDFSLAERSRLNANARLLHAILNDSEKAIAPIEEIDEDEREYWKHVMHGLIVALDADEKHTSSKRAALALRSLRRAADHLANISTLDVRNLAFCSKVESYGRFNEFKSNGFKPGQEVLLYVEVENFAVESDDDHHETELQGEYTIYDVDGKRVANAVLPLDKQTSKNRRHDYFIAYRIFIPKKIEPGHYTLELTIEDLKGSKSNQTSVEFWIR